MPQPPSGNVSPLDCDEDVARARNIKPGFFQNEDLADLGPEAMLLFAGLWTLADREGRLEDRPKRIKAQLFPYFDLDVDVLLDDLQGRGFVIRYERGGSRYLQIVNFSKHQAPHYKEALSVIPAPDGWVDSPVVATGPTNDVRAVILKRDGKCLQCGSTEDLTLDHIIPRSVGGTDDPENLQTLCRRCNSGKNNRDHRSMVGQSLAESEAPLASDTGFSDTPLSDPGLSDSGASDTARAAPPKPKRATQMVEAWEPSAALESWAAGELGMRYEQINAETCKFRDYFIATGKPMKDWGAAWKNWMRRSREFAARAPTGKDDARKAAFGNLAREMWRGGNDGSGHREPTGNGRDSLPDGHLEAQWRPR